MIRAREGNKREDLIKAAKYLFMTEGIKNVSVSKIVKKAGVAQGTFYLYFNSKDKILDAVAEKVADEICNNIVKIANNQQSNALEKLMKIFTFFSDLSSLPNDIVQQFHRQEHKEVHNRLAEAAIKKIVPFLEKILEQGVKEGLFDIKHPKEAAQILISVANYPHDEIFLNDKKALRRWEKTVTDFILKGLGVRRK